LGIISAREKRMKDGEFPLGRDFEYGAATMAPTPNSCAIKVPVRPLD
jgi:hypothetical protein